MSVCLCVCLMLDVYEHDRNDPLNAPLELEGSVMPHSG